MGVRKAFTAGLMALATAGGTTYVASEYLPTVISDLGGHKFHDDTVAAASALNAEKKQVMDFDLTKPAGPTDLGVDLANARMKLIVDHCSRTERENALTAPLNRPPCAEAPLDERAIKTNAIAAVEARHEGDIRNSQWAKTAYDAGVVGAQGLTIAFGFYVAFGIGRFGFRGGSNNNGGGGNNGGKGPSGNRGRGRKQGETQLDLAF